MISSAEEFVALRTSDAPEEYLRAAHGSAPLEVWLEVVERYPALREWVAHNKTVPVEVLAVLSDDRDPRVRWAVATKRKLPEALQLKLAGDPDGSVRQRIAYNAKATRAALERLAADEWDAVREQARERLRKGRFVYRDG